MPDDYTIADYLLDNYGTCVRGSDCFWDSDRLGHPCLRVGWLGRQCRYWKPLGITTLDELKMAMVPKKRK